MVAGSCIFHNDEEGHKIYMVITFDCGVEGSKHDLVDNYMEII